MVVRRPRYSQLPPPLSQKFFSLPLREWLEWTWLDLRWVFFKRIGQKGPSRDAGGCGSGGTAEFFAITPSLQRSRLNCFGVISESLNRQKCCQMGTYRGPTQSASMKSWSNGYFPLCRWWNRIWMARLGGTQAARGMVVLTEVMMVNALLVQWGICEYVQHIRLGLDCPIGTSTCLGTGVQAYYFGNWLVNSP